MIPCCFRQPKPNKSSSSSIAQVPQHAVTYIYQTKLCNSPTYHMTLTWSRTLSSHSLTIHAPYIFSNSIIISLNPSSTFSLSQSKLHASKSISNRRYSHKIKFHWNFSKAKFNQNSAEPHSCFYFAISCNDIVQFFMGDIRPNLKQNQEKSTNSVLLSRTEHMLGRTSYVSHAILMGSKHEIKIECKEGVLSVKVDGEIQLAVRRMVWKFKGYEKIMLLEGIQVEFYWDVLLSWTHNNNNNNGSIGQSVFIFQVGDYIKGTMWPEMVGVQKRLTRKNMCDSDSTVLLQWANGNNSESCCGSHVANGFSLLPYAWTQN